MDLEQNMDMKTYIKRQCSRAISTLIPHNPNQRLTILEQARLQRDDDELHSRTSMFTNICRNPRHVRIIERGVDLVQDKERRRLVRVDGEKERQGSHGLLTTREVLHVAETFEGWHCVVLDAIEVWLVGGFDIEVSVTVTSANVRRTGRVLTLAPLPFRMRSCCLRFCKGLCRLGRPVQKYGCRLC